MDEDNRSAGQVAFEAYNEAKGGKTYDDKPIPPWDQVGEKVQAGWEAAANAVIEWYDPEGELTADSFTDDYDDEESDDGASG